MSFKSDIQGKNTQLYPIVTIEPPENVGNAWSNTLANRVMKLSTNNVSLYHVHSLFEGNVGMPVKDAFHFNPLLLNIPSIKESIDIESRKFKISNVSLDISNIEYQGKRFTDMLSDTSLINWKCSIQFVSPSANKFSTIYTTSLDGKDQSFYEAYTGETSNTVYGNEEYRSQMAQMVYQGVIRRISHDDEKVRVELEDLTEQKAHKNLLQESLGISDDIPDKYKNKPIPMVYGHVDKSPVVISKKTSLYILDEEEEGFVSTLDVDTRELGGFVDSVYTIGNSGYGGKQFNISPLYINDGEAYINIKQGSTEGIYDNFIFPDSNTIQFPTSLNSDFATNGQITTEIPRKIEKVSWSIDYGRDILSDFDLSLGIEGHPQSLESYSMPNLSGDDARRDGAKFLITDGNPNTAIDVDGIISDTWDGSFILRIYAEALNSEYPCDTYVAVEVSRGNEHTAYWRLDAGLEERTVNIDSATASNLTESFDSFSGASLLTGHKFSTWDSIMKYDGFSIQVPQHIDYTALGEEDSFVVDLRIYEAHLYHIAYIDNVIKNDFYVNVKGRTNTFNDHPSYLVSNNIPVGYWVENPIDIIYDLVRSELGHDAIDEAEYAEARLAHNNWKFGFTISKKINSKKLIEDIAKSTKCFPKFKNDGTFGFNAIKDSYDVANDYDSATQIKEAEVISYSFKKTKPEQIYKEVTVSYNKDYAQDSYLKTVNRSNTYDATGIGADPHYGIEKSEDAHLEFESDYIRHDAIDGAEQTADKLAEFLYQQYRNDHLIFNLKLPLKYIDLEIGDLVKFRELFQGLKAYGIDYRTITLQGYGTNLDSQWLYPLFIITSTTKNLDSVSIECIQLHNLQPSEVPGGDSVLPWLDGMIFSVDGGEDGEPIYWGDGVNGKFYFSDSEPLVIPEDIATEIVITPPNIIINAPITTDIDTEDFTYDLHTHQATVIDGDQAGTDITDLLVVESMGQTFTGGQSHFVGEVDTDTNQIAVTYSITSPTTGLQSIQIFNYNINVREHEPPSITVTSMAGAVTSEGEGSEFIHHVSLADNFGADYIEKYVYNTSEFQEIQYSAVDNDNGEDLTNSIVFGNPAHVHNASQGEDHTNFNPFYLAEQWLTFYPSATFYEIDLMAFVMSPYGLYSHKTWKVRVALPTDTEGYLPSGDINLDGVVDILDVVRVVNYVLADVEGSAPPLLEEQLHQADITQDGTIDVLDIVTLVNVIMEN